MARVYVYACRFVNLIVNKITSLHNQRLKETLKLTKRAVRDERRLTVVEGLREVSRALDRGVIPVEAFVCPPLIQGQEAECCLHLLQRFEQTHRIQVFEVTPEVFAKLAYREQGDGLLLVIRYLDQQLAQLSLSPTPFLCIIEGVEKPGNLGAILRTADAAGVDAVIVCAGATDLHNPNVIRASLGALFTVPVVEAPTDAAIHWLAERKIQIIAATPEAPLRYTDANLAGPVAIVMGSEAHGLSATWRAAATATVAIPMHGMADSLNLATATALLLYEAVRQRNLKPS
jgi:RNA methyltransferase, TrmH family